MKPVRRTVDPFAHIRRNHRIKAPEVRAIGPDGRQIGVIPLEKALQVAQQLGLDLVEVSPNAQPPVCRILDFGKFKYEEQKKMSHAKTSASKIKEVKLRVRIEAHDFQTKMRHAEDFLNHGNKVKLTLQFRGREMAFREAGFETMRRAIADLNQIGTPDNESKLIGRSIIVMMSPLPPNKRKLKYNQPDQPPLPELPPEHDDEEEDADDEHNGENAGTAPRA